MMMQALLLALLLQDPPAQDTVVLSNGDTLSGKVVKLEGGVLIFETGYSKPIAIEAAKIKSITTAGPVKVQLTSGEVVEGKLAKGEDGHLVVQSGAVGDSKSIPWASVKAFNPIPARYKGVLSLAASATSGNTERMTLSFSAEAERRTDDDRLTLRFLTNYAEENELVTVQNTFGALKYDYFFSVSLYGYLNLELLADHFKDLNLRSMAGGGIGWQILPGPVVAWSLEAGAAYLNEDFRTGPDQDQVVARLATTLVWVIRDGLTFSQFLQILPQFEDSEALFRSESKVSALIAGGLSGFVAVIVDYDSDPPVKMPRVKKADILYLLGIQFTIQ